MTYVIIVALVTLFLACVSYFGVKKTALTAYYAMKYVVFKSIEFLIRLVIALFRINFFIWAGWGVMVLVLLSPPSDQGIKLILFWLTMFVSWLIFMLAIRYFCDEDDRDDVRALLAELEHKLCFKNKKLSIYPHDWIWF